VAGVREDVDLIAKHMHKDFLLITYPQSLGHPELNREPWIEPFAGVFSALAENKVASRINRCSSPLHRG